MLYPPVYLGVALAKWISGDLRWTIEWIATGHLTMGLIGFSAWLRQGGVSRVHAALGALAWVLNPFILIVTCSWVNVSFVACYLPWLFWSLDRLFVRPSHLSAFFLGAILALFFLQGTVQWVCYAILFLGLYALLCLIVRTEICRLSTGYYLIASALVFLTLVTPLLLPMIHATAGSFARSRPLPIIRALDFPGLHADLVNAQFFLFRPDMVFGVSTIILYCPALLLSPLMLLWFFGAGAEARQRLFPLLVLSGVALIFASRWHILLTLMPVFGEIPGGPSRCLFLLNFSCWRLWFWSISFWWPASSVRRSSRWGAACLTLVLLLGLVVSLPHHDENYFSPTTLPAVDTSPPPGLDVHLGRVMAIDQVPSTVSDYRFYTCAYGTFFAVPALGGYNPLVGREQLEFALGLDFPNIFFHPITPEVRRELDAKSVRYWIVDPHSSASREVEALAGLQRLDVAKDRLIFENKQAAPLVYSSTAPTIPCAMTYAGNSILVPLNGIQSPVEISVGPTDGWWYRIDRGAWLRPVYQNDRLKIDFPASSRLLEISYFDARFRAGLRLSAAILIFWGFLVIAARFFSRGSK